MARTDRPEAQWKAWIAQVNEAALDPELPICDPHHHLWRDKGHTGWPYLLDDLHADTGRGHNVVRTVYLECHAEYLTDGPEHMRPVGETQFVIDVAEQSARTGKAEIAGIVGHANLALGDAIEEILAAHEAAARGRFRGIRYITAEDPHPPLSMGRSVSMDHAGYLAGVRKLGALNYSYDAMVYHPQLPLLATVARSCPDTRIVINHLGGFLGTGPYKDRREESMLDWRAGMAQLAKCPNTYLKLGGIGMPMMGHRWDKQDVPATSQQLADLWGDPIRYAIEQFGAERCMFESNYPVDMRGAGYAVLWNAFKRITMDLSADEKRFLFHDAAA
ncbi:MAG: amidohydrolase family protein, partial [Chromatiales bacterium]|nr:amidohydrolase family protein [Chromatiales bacterium]